jgi:Spy/CpxP family protein refolding chaperone
MNSSRNKVLLALVAILLLTNLALVAFFVLKKEPQKKEVRQSRSAAMRGMLKDSVGFNEQQLQQFDAIRQQHEQDLKPLFENMREAKLSFYQQMNASRDTAAITAAGDAIGETQKALDLAFYKYFQNIRAVCTPQQLTSYDSLVQRVVRRMVTPAKRGSPKDRKDAPREKS